MYWTRYFHKTMSFRYSSTLRKMDARSQLRALPVCWRRSSSRATWWRYQSGGWSQEDPRSSQKYPIDMIPFGIPDGNCINGIFLDINWISILLNVTIYPFVIGYPLGFAKKQWRTVKNYQRLIGWWKSDEVAGEAKQGAHEVNKLRSVDSASGHNQRSIAWHAFEYCQRNRGKKYSPF